jgi:hypothetical protein
MRSSVLTTTAILLLAGTARAQADLPTRLEIRPFAGAFIPLGQQRGDFRNATMVGLQGAMEVNSRLHFVGTVGWTHGHNRFTPGTNDLTHIWQTDVGVEGNIIRPINARWELRPFAGAGAGIRMYNYSAKTLERGTCSSTFVAAGSEAQRGVIALRFEARNYLSCFESPVTRKRTTRDDLALSLGMAWHIR